MSKKAMLIILDGWGLNPDPERSAVERANTPFIDEMMKTRPNSTLHTFGEFVGLPEGQMGNSEVGHMNIGAGRVIYQDLLKINRACDRKELNNNPVLVEAIAYAKRNYKKIHLIGLVSDGGVHSHIRHTLALTDVFKDFDFSNVAVHMFTDGRDTDPKSGLTFLKVLQEHLKNSLGQIASVTGRYYAMDRDTRWERTALAYHALVNGRGESSRDLESTLKKRYEAGETDEFIKPIIHVDEKGVPLATIQKGDVVIYTNFRGDRGRQLTEALTQKNHPEVDIQTIPLHYITFKSYDREFQNIFEVFDSSGAKNTMGEVLANSGLRQLRIAETEKYPHVTYFFNNGREEAFEGEDRIVVPSPRDVATYDLKPEMSAFKVKDQLVAYLDTHEVDFVCLNFANADMVAHTGDFKAAMRACEVVDQCAREVVEKALEKDFSVIIIADHGNADYMVNDDGSPNTNHSMYPVPCILIQKEIRGKIINGSLCDVAPTLLSLMEIEIPKEMEGKVLVH